MKEILELYKNKIEFKMLIDNPEIYWMDYHPINKGDIVDRIYTGKYYLNCNLVPGFKVPSKHFDYFSIKTLPSYVRKNFRYYQMSNFYYLIYIVIPNEEIVLHLLQKE
jgi:hypothetical protein